MYDSRRPPLSVYERSIMDISLFFHKRKQEVKEKSSKRFNAWSQKYDRSILQLLVFSRSHDMFVKNIAGDDSAMRILDVGCGTGELAMRLKQQKKGSMVSGIDLSADMINIAKAKAKSNGSGDIDFRIGDVEHMPYEDSYFDCVTCAHSFHHYPHKKKALREMFRVLKNNGKVMIIDGYKDGVLGRFIFDFIIKKHEIDVHHLHSNQFRRLLTSVGFNNIVQKTFNPIIPLLFTKGVASKRG